MKYDPHEKDRHFFSFTLKEIEGFIKEFEDFQDILEKIDNRVYELKDIFEGYQSEHNAIQNALDE